ncbi:Cobalamin biosynthesis protein CbiG [Archaeoglobus sulfaticallidus PM70-1]|uniref:Cobalamin biosynthesis protein CbiG n=1 Tax=Archaeoglobus sulfaticallidus PM70-1 TaxID=387631 RepID=N0BAF4_9EURY|nr:cobalamin biosynthesis protein [Archaeoglobus sulfaticallidus]AGK60574.1 Cobalamin biosynthesis protein CbiG [Archaeoglobus sulfaticallidus PM70-1]
MKIALLCFERDAEKLKEIKRFLEKKYDVDTVIYKKHVWEDLTDYDCVVAYMPSGIVVRGICPYLKSKWTDPAVVVLDKPLMHAIPVLGGHHGGNEIAKYLETFGMKAIITTAMEFSHGLSVGVGFRKSVKADEIILAIRNTLKEINAEMEDVRVLSTIEDKKGSVILEVADELKKPIIFVKRDELNSMDVQETKAKIIGVKNVAEACAIYSSSSGELLLPKRVYGGVTVAIAR